MKYLILIISSLYFASTNAQVAFNVELKTGYSFYKMADLSARLNTTGDHKGYGLKITDDFPAFYTWGIGTHVTIKKWSMGLDYTRYSTGGRTHYADYSGEAGTDYLVDSHSLGITAGYTVWEGRRISISSSLMVSHYPSEFRYIKFLRFPDEKIEEEMVFFGSSFAITPMLGGTWTFFETWYLGASVGFCFDSRSTLKWREDETVTFTDWNANDITVDWTGFRSEVFVGYRLKFTD